MFAYIWPIALVVFSNVLYHICCKSVPDALNPFASLIVTYIVGAVVAAVCYFILYKGGNLLKEFSHINWAPFALGISIVGLEVGFIFAYKAGWLVSTASIVQAAFLTCVLVFVGILFYKEQLSFSKIIGIVICLIGLVFINK